MLICSMNDSQNKLEDNNIDNVVSPDVGSIGLEAAGGFQAPKIEQPSAGVEAAPEIAQPVDTQRTNIDPIRAALKAEMERTKVPFDVNPQATAQMMEDNEKALRRQREQQVVIIQEHPITGIFRVTGNAIASFFRRR